MNDFVQYPRSLKGIQLRDTNAALILAIKMIEARDELIDKEEKKAENDK